MTSLLGSGSDVPSSVQTNEEWTRTEVDKPSFAASTGRTMLAMETQATTVLAFTFTYLAVSFCRSTPVFHEPVCNCVLWGLVITLHEYLLIGGSVIALTCLWYSCTLVIPSNPLVSNGARVPILVNFTSPTTLSK